MRWLIGIGGVDRQPLFFAFGLCTGAGWYASIWTEPALWPLLLAATSAIFVLLWASRRWLIAPILLSGLIFLTGSSVGALAGKLATLRVSHPVITDMIGPVMVEGWVEEIEPAKRGVRLRLIVHAIDDVPRANLPDRVRVTHTTRLAVESGRFVRCWAVLRPPPGPIVKGDYAFDRQAYFEGLGAVGYVQGRCRGGALGAPSSRLNQFRLWVAKHRRNLGHYVYQASGERAGGFAAALASGDRSFMSTADQEALRGSGLAHLLAISGLHMGIVGGLIYLMVWRGLALIEPIALRIPVQKPAAVAALIASLVYLILSGASVSTQRAFIMAAVLFGAVLFDRVALSLRSLSIAMIIVVLLSPWSVLTPGFQMSFAATGALIATYEAWQRRRRELAQPGGRGAMFWIKSLAVTSLVSGLATMPFAMYHFDRVAGFGLLANLIAMPIISLATAPLAALALLLSPFGVADFALGLFGKTLEGVLIVAHTFNALAPGGTSFGKPMPGSVLLLLVVGLVLVSVVTGWRRRLVAGTVCAAAAGSVWISTPMAGIHWGPSGEVFLVDEGRVVERIELVKGDGLAPLRFVDVPVAAGCSNTVCTRQISGVRVLLFPGDLDCQSVLPDDLVLVVGKRAEGAECGRSVYTWDEVQRAGGISWRVHGEDQTQIVKRPPCGERPWKLCSVD